MRRVLYRCATTAALASSILIFQVFLDVIESVNLLASATGNVLRSEIVGCIKMRVYLSGMPELRLDLKSFFSCLLRK